MPASTSPDAPAARGRRRSRTGAVPAVLLVPALVGLGLLVLPLAGLLVRTPWGELGTHLTAPAVLDALRLSLVTATVATALGRLSAGAMPQSLARADLPGSPLLRALVTVPLVLPPVVGGVALLLLLGRRGLLGEHLDTWFGVTVPFTTAAVVLAQTFVAMPFLVIAVEGALRGADRRYEDAAATLGASRWTTFRRVTLPLVAPGVSAGAILCFARALGEFGATITFAGSFPGVTRTMPIAVYLALETDPESAIVLSLLLLVVSVGVLAALRGRWVSGVGA